MYKQKKDVFADWLFILPALLINILIILIPALITIVLSFMKWNGLGLPSFDGLNNFKTVFATSSFYTALFNNIKWTIFFLTVPIILALFVAVILLYMRRARAAFQSIFFVPNIISPVIICTIFSTMILHPRSGIIGYINNLSFFSVKISNPLASVRSSLFTVMCIDCWHWWGFLTVIFLAAMRQVDENIIEAAEIDGAGFFRKFISVIIPGIKSNILFMLLMTIIWSFLTFDYVWILTGGGPAGSSEMLSTLSYRASFYIHNIGLGATYSLIMSFLAGIVIIFYVLMQIKGQDAV
ncbi:sugar ABC transporter permease [Treponema sp. HNW]|uniref:carbohydrate ABC transporter permease n=1 Tax=Treponema sp. HNW TaxID=3116654 RepID=UPI003D0E0221